MTEYFRSALLSIWSNKIRSLLNILGVVIGVSSVTILVALGEGLKLDVSGLIQGFGTNVMVVTGGKLDAESLGQGGGNPANFISGDVLTMADVETIESSPGIEAVSPGNVVPGTLRYHDKTASPLILGVYPNFLQTFDVLEVKQGAMFASRQADRVIVLGKTARTVLFGEADPVGKKVTIGQTELEVIGTVETGTSSSVFGSDLDNLTLIPFDTATELNKNQEKVFRIYAKGQETAKVDELKKELTSQITTNHNGEEDFTVLTQDDLLGLFNTFLTLATTLVSAIAAISLVVGGIGIMNIMLVTVTERTREIGLRKAVGATKLAILWQFLIEAIVVTFIGSLLGLAIAFLVSLIVAAKTELQPSITAGIIGIAVGISVLIGIIFGLWPAIRAANKDPIEALRYE